MNYIPVKLLPVKLVYFFLNHVKIVCNKNVITQASKMLKIQNLVFIDI